MDLIRHVISILDRPLPRIGANNINVNGKSVDVWVEYVSTGEYTASQMEWDIGMPITCRTTIAAALHDLREILEEQDAQANGECMECKRTDGCDDCYID